MSGRKKTATRTKTKLAAVPLAADGEPTPPTELPAASVPSDASPPESGLRVDVAPRRDVVPDQSDSNPIYFLKRGQHRIDALLGYILVILDIDGEPIDEAQLRRYAREARENFIAAEGEIFAFEERVEAAANLFTRAALREALETYDWQSGTSTPVVARMSLMLHAEALAGTVRTVDQWRVRIGDVLKMLADSCEVDREVTS